MKGKNTKTVEVPFGWFDYLSHYFPIGIVLFEIHCFDTFKTIYPAFFISYAFFPLLDYLTPLDHRNPNTEQVQALKKDSSWTLPLYAFVIAQVYQMYFTFRVVYYDFPDLPWIECILFVLTMASNAATSATIGHELMHRKQWYHNIMGTLLYLRMLNTNFIIEHNQTHHKWVGTPLDPASAKLGEDVYSFGVKSVIYSQIDGFKVEKERVQKTSPNLSSIELFAKNRVVQLKLLELVFLGGVFYFWGAKVLIYQIVHSLIEAFLLEIINYIEHYGLRRKEIAPGKYERVSYRHSWNAAHRWTNALLYKLQRHSDHHIEGTKPYQALISTEQSPQLPHGYGLSLMFATKPSLWFKIMDPLVKAYMDHERNPSPEELEESAKWVRRGFWENQILVTAFGLFYYVIPALLF